MRNSVKISFRAAVFVALAAFFVSGTAARAQIGFTAYLGGTIPTGEFGKTDLDRDPPKSGAENGHAFGAGAAGRLITGDRLQHGFGIHPDVIVTFEFGESEFGNDVPTVIVSDSLQIATPQSRIRMRAFRLGVRILPWAQRVVSPSLGGGIQLGKMKVQSRAFFGPGKSAVKSNEPMALQITSESDNIVGVFALVGVAARSGESAVFFAEAVFHRLFSKDVATTTEYEPSEAPPDEGKIKSNFQWWELRAGLVTFF